MNITDLIVEFIQQGNVVEIPNIGTLTSTNVSAHHDASKGTYYPSRRTVTLNSSVSGNKAIVRRIAEKECVTNEIAEQMWNNYLGALDEKLQRNPAGHEFPGLGVLRRDGGKATFEAVEGLDLDAGKKREQPIEHITTYTPKAAVDPFAAFEKPVEEPKPVAPEPVSAPAPEAPAAAAAPVAPQAAAKPAPAPRPALRPETEKAAEISAVKVPQEAQSAPAEVEKIQRQMEKEKARAEKEAKKAAEEARKASEREAKAAERRAKAAEREIAEAKKQAAADELKIKKEMERDRKRAEKAAEAEAHRALKDLKRQEKKAKKGEKKEVSKERKKQRTVLIIALILLLLLILAYGGYRYYRNYVPETKGTNNAKHVELPYYRRFSRDLAALEYDESDIDFNREKVDSYMADYIRVYLNARHYSNAFTVVMDRIDDYADERLHELMGEPQYAVQRLFPFHDYFREYCYEELQGVGGYVNRCRVQGELMDTERLDDFLDDLISELGLHPDGYRGMAGAAPVQAKAKPAQEEYVEVVPSAPTLKASKQGFDIIAGFCTQKSKADKMTNQLKSLGCDAYIINRSGLYYVSMGSAGSRTAAEALYNHIKSWYKGDITIKNWNE